MSTSLAVLCSVYVYYTEEQKELPPATLGKGGLQDSKTTLTAPSPTRMVIKVGYTPHSLTIAAAAAAAVSMKAAAVKTKAAAVRTERSLVMT